MSTYVSFSSRFIVPPPSCAFQFRLITIENGYFPHFLWILLCCIESMTMLEEVFVQS